MFEKVLNRLLQLYLFHALLLKKCEDKPYQYQSVQIFFTKNTLRVFKKLVEILVTACHLL